MPKTKTPPKPAKADDSHRLRLPSASSLSRAIRCQASTIVPGVREPSTYAQERGTLIHSFCEVGITRRGAKPRSRGSTRSRTPRRSSATSAARSTSPGSPKASRWRSRSPMTSGATTRRAS